MKSLFYHLFHSINKSFPIASFFMLIILPMNSFSPEGLNPNNKGKTSNDSIKVDPTIGSAPKPPPIDFN